MSKQPAHVDRNDSPSQSFKSDVNRVLAEINRSFNPLRKESQLDFRVTGARDGYVCVSIVMPEGMTRVFVSLLQSLHGFFRQIDLKAGHACRQNRPIDPEVLKEGQQRQEDYRKDVCSLFDGFIGQGLPINKAITRTNAAMKERKHPWATYDLISMTLRAEGRFRKQKRRRKV